MAGRGADGLARCEGEDRLGEQRVASCESCDILHSRRAVPGSGAPPLIQAPGDLIFVSSRHRRVCIPAMETAASKGVRYDGPAMTADIVMLSMCMPSFGGGRTPSSCVSAPKCDHGGWPRRPLLRWCNACQEHKHELDPRPQESRGAGGTVRPSSTQGYGLERWPGSSSGQTDWDGWAWILAGLVFLLGASENHLIRLLAALTRSGEDY